MKVPHTDGPWFGDWAVLHRYSIRKLACLLLIFLGLGFAKRADAGALVGGIATRDHIEQPFGRIGLVAVAQQKPSGCLPPLIAGPINKTRVEYERFLSRKRSIDIALGALVTRGWNQRGTDFRIIRVAWARIVEQRVPDRNALSGRQEPNVITGMILGRVRFGNGVALAPGNVFDRVNFEAPIPLECGFQPRIDESQYDTHWLSNHERPMVGSVYPHPSPVGFNGRVSSIYDAPDKGYKSGGADEDSQTANNVGYKPIVLFISAVMVFAGWPMFIYGLRRDRYWICGIGLSASLLGGGSIFGLLLYVTLEALV